MIGVRFKGTHSSSFDLVSKSEDRTVRPPLKRRELEIPGRHGRYDFGDNKYDNRILAVRFFSPNKNFQTLRQNMRKIAGWLSGKGELIFDDELDKFYQAKVYGQIPLEQLHRTGSFVVMFECEPFAYSNLNSVEVTREDVDPIFIFNNGTVETPHEITVTNLGGNTINGFIIKIIKNR